METEFDINKRMQMPPAREILSRLKSSAKKRGIYFDLTISDILAIDFPITCPILNVPMGWYRGKPRDESYSFDRIDSNLGYTFSNLQIISAKANRAKNNLTEEELQKFSTFYR